MFYNVFFIFRILVHKEDGTQILKLRKNLYPIHYSSSHIVFGRVNVVTSELKNHD